MRVNYHSDPGEDDEDDDDDSLITDPTPPRVGKVTLSSKDTSLSFHCNALAFDGQDRNNTLMVLSVAGAATSIKALTASLVVKSKTVVKPESIPGMNTYLDLVRCKEGYTFHRSRMAYNTWHLLAIAKHDGILLNASEQAVWLALRDQRITTPIVRWWVPYLLTTLRKSHHIRPLRCFGCEVAMFDANTEVVDRAVTIGIQQGQIGFERPGVQS